MQSTDSPISRSTDPPILQPEVFQPFPDFVAGFSTRLGGVSPAPFHALNLGRSTQDDEANVRANREKLFGALGFSVDDLAVAFQVHSNRVVRVENPGGFPECDGLVTDQPGLVLSIVAADCAAVLLADPQARVVGACHSGWRGTVGRISNNTVAEMQALGAAPERIHAYISPCISVENFEVGPEVAAQFDEQYVQRRPEWPRPHVDLKAVIAAQLEAAGVLPANIEVSPHCTMAETDRFFSHRAENGQTGRMMGFIAMRTGA